MRCIRSPARRESATAKLPPSARCRTSVACWATRRRWWDSTEPSPWLHRRPPPLLPAAFDVRAPDLHLAPGSSIAVVLALVERAAARDGDHWLRLSLRPGPTA